MFIPQYDREFLGRVVRAAWVAYCESIGDTNPAHIADWEYLSEQDKEADRQIGEAVQRLWTEPHDIQTRFDRDTQRYVVSFDGDELGTTRTFAQAEDALHRAHIEAVIKIQ